MIFSSAESKPKVSAQAHYTRLRPDSSPRNHSLTERISQILHNRNDLVMAYRGGQHLHPQLQQYSPTPHVSQRDVVRANLSSSRKLATCARGLARGSSISSLPMGSHGCGNLTTGTLQSGFWAMLKDIS